MFLRWFVRKYKEMDGAHPASPSPVLLLNWAQLYLPTPSNQISLPSIIGESAPAAELPMAAASSLNIGDLLVFLGNPEQID